MYIAINGYLDMTAAEIEHSTPLPPNVAWMACHFSPYTRGLSNRPKELPPGAMLILNDITPIHGHDPEEVAAQLGARAEALECGGVLLDFQRPGSEETAALVQHLPAALPCPVAVSEPYAADLDCPVFLPPVPHHVPLQEYLAPWQGREIWLEMALDSEVITLTPEGAAIAPLPPEEQFDGGHWEETLHCHYHIQIEEEQARFTLFRSREDLDALLEEAESLGVTTAVGLYQELGKPNTFPRGEGGTAEP